MRLFWHRRDLRTVDNVGLHAATEAGPTLPVYVLDSAVTDRLGDRQYAFLLDCARKLRDRYRALGSDLVIRTGAAADALADVAAEHDTETVVFNDHHSAARRAQQRRVRERFDAESHTDLTLVDMATLPERYPTHNQFHNDWAPVEKPDPVLEPAPATLATITDDRSIPESHGDVDVDTGVEVDRHLPTPGYEAARERLDHFVDHGIHSYADTRDDLKRAVDHPTTAVSRLSASLAVGAIGIREVWQAATQALRASEDDERRNVRKYRDELSWREHNYHQLSNEPRLHAVNYDDPPNEIEWRDHEGAAAADLAAWKRGETGYPLVDAGMRQLEREGYIHNRPRQVVASFLTKYLRIDWRVGAKWFRERLVDYDPASNEGNWQWIAGTGTDYVDNRIFTPVAQTAKYDADATFIAEYVPELAGVPAETVIEWPKLSQAKRDDLAPPYPDPIVDREEAYERAEHVFDRAFGKLD